MPNPLDGLSGISCTYHPENGKQRIKRILCSFKPKTYTRCDRKSRIRSMLESLAKK